MLALNTLIKPGLCPGLVSFFSSLQQKQSGDPNALFCPVLSSRNKDNEVRGKESRLKEGVLAAVS